MEVDQTLQDISKDSSKNENAKLDEIREDANELRELLKQAKRKRTQDLLTVEIRKLETKITQLKDALALEKSKEEQGSKAASKVTSNYKVKINGYGWDQSEKFVKIFVTLKDAQTVPKEQVYYQLTDRSMELHIDNLAGKDYYLIINNLLEKINPEGSYFKQKNDMVVVFLAKLEPGKVWSHVTLIDKKFDENKSNKFKSKETPEVTDPQDSIMGIMKNMYDSGDDEMKKMIAKAWTESMGKTHTSTVDD